MINMSSINAREEIGSNEEKIYKEGCLWQQMYWFIDLRSKFAFKLPVFYV
jgi:hypothetical protein